MSSKTDFTHMNVIILMNPYHCCYNLSHYLSCQFNDLMCFVMHQYHAYIFATQSLTEISFFWYPFHVHVLNVIHTITIIMLNLMIRTQIHFFFHISYFEELDHFLLIGLSNKINVYFLIMQTLFKLHHRYIPLVTITNFFPLS